ncbi:MAG: peptidylprolyl isomerase [Candidatus Poribacteria bacterium]|nr:peptidylprolyl isomerase [Candidatus Poribacteria bacterium]
MRNLCRLTAVVGMLAWCIANATAQSDETLPAEPPPQDVIAAEPTEADSTDAEVSILNRSTPLGKNDVYVEGGNVIFTESIAHVTSVGDERAFLRYENMTLEADEMRTDLKEILRAEGNVRLQVDEEITYAETLIFNMKTKKGIAYGGAAYGAPWYYQGYEILRVSEKESLINNGILTTSSLKYPHTYFKASRIIVHLGKEIIAKHVVFMVGGVPLLYIPAYRRSIRDDKPSTVIVKLGSDSFQGTWATVIVPLARRDRLRSVVQLDYSTLRGTGYGFENQYRVRDVELREIQLKKPEGATPEEITALRRTAREIGRRLRGEYNLVRIKRLFIPFEMTEGDRQRARTSAEELMTNLAAPDADFAALAGKFTNTTTYMAAGDGVLAPDLEAVALALEYAEISPLIERPEGFYMFRVNDVIRQYGRVEKQVQQIFIGVEPSDGAKETGRELTQRLVERLQTGANFDELMRQYGGALPRSIATEGETGELLLDVWIPKVALDFAQRRQVGEIQRGETLDPVEKREGMYLMQYVDEEETPDFVALAKEISDSDTAEDGGYIGFIGQRDVPRQVYNASVGLDKGEVSEVVETEEAFWVVQNVGKRNMQGEAIIFTKDIASYGSRESFTTGRQWDIGVRHQQDIRTRWDRKGRRTAFWGRVDYGSRQYKEITYGRDRAELRTFGVLTFDSQPISARVSTPSFRSRLTIDKTFSFEEETSGTIQKLPEYTFAFSGQLEGVFGFKQLNRKMQSAARSVEKLGVPLLKFPTLDSTTFTFDGSVANLLRDRYRYATDVFEVRQARGLSDEQTEDVYLRTVDVGLDAQKTSKIELTSTREITVAAGGSSQLVWHEKDQKGNTNILRSVISGNGQAQNDLFHVYNISWIPGASRLRHNMTTTVGFDWAPSVNDDKDPDNPDPDAVELYPFGSSTYLYERKLLRMSFQTDLQIKTRLNKVVNGLSFRLSTSRDYTDRVALSNRKWEFLTGNARLTPLASNNLTGTINFQIDPNTYGPDSTIQREPWTLVQFASSLRYRKGDYQKGWTADIGTSYQRLTTRSSRSFVLGYEWRPNTLFEVDIDTRFDYDRVRAEESDEPWRDNAILKALSISNLHGYSQQISVRRNLRDWDLRITWRRTGGLGSVRKEFTYQINLIADPSITIGTGYDAVSGTWGFRSLPIGVPPTFTGGSLGSSRF